MFELGNLSSYTLSLLFKPENP